jgi:CDP-4-dehydro-6-deoxyglucose reductase, E1
MPDHRTEILAFIASFREAHGALPKFAYNLKEFNNKVYYSGPWYEDAELAAAIEALLVGKWASSGTYVHKFEQEFSKAVDQRFSVMVNSGSSANLAMLAALKKFYDWQDGDEIAVSVVGFPTTIAPIVQNGMKPAFVDIEFETLNFDLDRLERACNEKTRAVFVSPVLGNPPDFDRVLEIADKKKLVVILDGCDSFGSLWRGKSLASYSAAASCSFYPAHHITTIEGGMVSSNTEEIVKIARSFAWWGRGCWCVGPANLLPNGTCGNRFSAWIEGQDTILDHKYVFEHMGYNLKPIDLQGAIGLEQLKRLDEIHTKRRAHQHLIQELFQKHVPGLKFPVSLAHAETSWFGVPILCESHAKKTRLVAYLEQNGVQTRNYFAGNILIHPGYRKLGDYRAFPEANRVLEEVFFVGCAPTYTQDHFEYLETVLAAFH